MKSEIAHRLNLLMLHVCQEEAVCCTRGELAARNHTKRMIADLRDLIGRPDVVIKSVPKQGTVSKEGATHGA